MAHSTEVNIDATGYVVRGYDPVVFFTEGRPVPGRPDFSAEYKGGTYLFATAANRDAFKANPEKYAPQYGGYCAYGVAVGKKFDIDPASWLFQLESCNSRKMECGNERVYSQVGRELAKDPFEDPV